jgi:tetraacyldisaccharide 4'-kinase
MRNKLFLFWEKIQRKRASFFWIIALLFPLSLLFRFVSCCQLWWRKYARKKYQSAAKVIFIGNITAGGTGKTPSAIYMAQLLFKKGDVAICTRGYGSSTPKTLKIIKKNEESPYTEKELGDEPFLMQKKIPWAHFVIHSDRIKALKQAEKKAPFCIFDDALRQEHIISDLKVICVDPDDPLGGGLFLPAGKCRISPKKLADADLIFSISSNRKFDRLEQKLKKYTKAPLVGFTPYIEGFYNQKGVEKTITKMQPLLLMCGIAVPERSQQLLQESGYKITDRIDVADHGVLQEKKLRSLLLRARNEKAVLICTEKDAVKYESFEEEIIHYKYGIEPTYGKAHLKMNVEKIVSDTDNCKIIHAITS